VKKLSSEYALSLLGNEEGVAPDGSIQLVSPVIATPVVNPAFVGVSAVAVPAEYKE
jgi:hypothetical protein